MKRTYTEVAKQIVLSYLENLASKDMITFEGLQEVLAIKGDKTNKILLEHIKAIKNIMENAIKEIERLNKRVKECEEAYLRTRHQYSELEGKYVIDEYVINELEKWLKAKGQLNFQTFYIQDAIDKLQELKGDSSNGNK